MAMVIYGPAYSTYTRSARLALEEKGAAYELVDVDMLGGKHHAPEHLARNPFGPVPAFADGDFTLYETDAIVRYVDEVVPGPKLTPADPKARARMNQIIGINDSFGYGAIIGKLFWQRAVVPMMGGAPDDAIVQECLPRVRMCLAEWERLMGQGPWLAGAEISLADIMLGPVMAYMSMTPEGGPLLAERPGLARWWQAMTARPSMVATAPQLG